MENGANKTDRQTSSFGRVDPAVKNNDRPDIILPKEIIKGTEVKKNRFDNTREALL